MKLIKTIRWVTGQQAGCNYRAAAGEISYKGFKIVPTDPKPPIPDRSHDWTWVHFDYDGPEDNRIGTAASPEACMGEINEFLAEQEGVSF